MQLLSNTTRQVALIPGRDYAIFAAGSFGSGTLTLTLADSTLTATLPMPEHGSITADTMFVFTAPGPRLTISLTGATSPYLAVDCTLCATGV
ncbi:MAG: hypothetical protein EOP87_24580 [Verrucomicrobiaceae bacterium]|nr:MAG: hypothetical protein EOP87_24580 [Verrucomicrobiaceae bacterium]